MSDTPDSLRAAAVTLEETPVPLGTSPNVVVLARTLPAMFRRYAAVLSENERLKRELAAFQSATQLCEKHKPTGGTRSVCLICAGIKLSAALSQIDYAIGEPNEMEVSVYDVDCNEERVVNDVKKMKAEIEKLREIIKRYRGTDIAFPELLQEIDADADAALDAAKGENAPSRATGGCGRRWRSTATAAGLDE